MLEMCPPRYLKGSAPTSLYGFTPNVPHVSMWSDKVIPYGFANGGMVDESHVNIPDGVLKKDDPDKVLVRLMPGELIVPKKHVSIVSQFLKKKRIFLPNM